MNNSLTVIFIFISAVSASFYFSNFNTEQVDVQHDTQFSDFPFDISFQIDQLEKDQFSLSSTLEMEDGSYVISPFSKDSVYGHFEISIAKNRNFISDDSLTEIPNSVEEFDSIIDMPVRFVRENTTFKQKFKVANQADFEVSGLIEFVLEPRCIPYDVEFVIFNKSGKMEIKKTKTSISKEYKL